MEEKDRITLVCTSTGENMSLLQKMLDSRYGKSGDLFDENIIHLNGKVIRINGEHTQLPKLFNIPDAYNFIIGNFVKTQWVCCMPDDDHFYSQGLSKMIDEVHNGITAGVAHFRFTVSGHIPKQDIRGRSIKLLTGKSEYELCEKRKITPALLKKHGRLPAVSFFRKRAWEMVGGFSGEFEHDRILWTKMAKKGIEFKFFDYLVYNYVRRDNSAWIKQNSINPNIPE